MYKYQIKHLFTIGIPNIDESKYKLIFNNNNTSCEIIDVIESKTILNVDLYGYPYIYTNHINLIKKFYNLNIELPYSNTSILKGFLEDLYFMYNPMKIIKRNGTLYSKVISAFEKRNEYHTSYVYTKTSQHLDKTLREYFDKKVSESYPQLVKGTIHYAKIFNRLVCNNSKYYRLGYCEVTGVPFVNNNYTTAYLSSFTQKSLVETNVNLANHGYTSVFIDSENYSNRRVYLKENERVYHNQIYIYDGTIDVETCPICGNIYPSIFKHKKGCCIKCAENQYKIHSYSTRAESLLKFKATKVSKETIYLGCELEYETKDKDSAKIKVGDLLDDHAIMKSDGSISNGFEIVTCPATIDIHLNKFKEFFDSKPSELFSAPNVGMHVHVSKKPLSTLTIGKLTRFMNYSDNKKFIEFIAGRKANRYSDINEYRSKTLSYPLYQKGDRYNFLNLQPNETIEFRIFSTPDDYFNFAYKLEFVQAIVDYSKPCACPVPAYEHKDWKTFKSWVLRTPKVYPNLSTKLKEVTL